MKSTYAYHAQKEAPAASKTPNTKKIDRRVLKTRKAIEDAFEKLIVDNDYDKITVSAIAAEANINRKTFYLHYSSVDDVLDSMAADFAEESLTRLTEQGFFDQEPLQVKRVAQALGEIYREARLINPLFMRKLPINHLIDVSQAQWERVIVRERVRKGLPPLENTVYYVRFLVGGMLTTYESWYNSGDNTSFEEVAGIVAYSLLYGVNGILNGYTEPSTSD